MAAAALAKPSAEAVVVIALVSMQLRWPLTPGTTAGPDRWDAAHKRLQAQAVVHVRPGDAEGQRQSVPVVDQMDLRSQLAAVGRIRSRQRPPFAARTLAESIAHRDQSSSPLSPSRSSTTRCSLAHTRAADQAVKRRWTVCQAGPKTGGSCRQVQPEAATKTIAARASRSPPRRRPPPLRTYHHRRRHHPPGWSRSGPSVASGSTSGLVRPPNYHRSSCPIPSHSRPPCFARNWSLPSTPPAATTRSTLS